MTSLTAVSPECTLEVLVLEPKGQLWVVLIDGESPGAPSLLSDLDISGLGLGMEVEKAEEM